MNTALINTLLLLCTWSGHAAGAAPTVRLAGSNDTWQGRVEVFLRGQWGTVCDDGWGIKDADVVCRQLGYSGALFAYCCSTFGPGSGQILLDNVKCIGNESSIAECANKGEGIHNCWHSEDASVACIHPYNADESNRTLGSCDFSVANGLCGYTNDQSNDDFDWMLGNGRSVPWYLHTGPDGDHTNGSHGFFLYIDTTTRFVAQGQSARLISPTLSNGSCLQFYYHMWGKTIGELNVYLQEVGSTSEVVWRMMGNQGDHWKLGTVPLPEKKSKFKITFEGVAGSGREGVIGLDDISILKAKCQTTPSSAVPKHPGAVTKAVRLQGSGLASAGRLEVFHKNRPDDPEGRWGTVCGHDFDINDADVACRELKYESAELVVPCCHTFGGGSGPIWLDSLRCQGQEPSISLCPHRGWGVTKCSHDDDVGVICKTSETDKTDFNVRLKGSPLPYKGRVEIKIGGIWGSVDDLGWDIFDSTVACRQLGLSGAVGVYSGSIYGSGPGPVWLSGVQCQGNERSLSRCKHTRIKTYNTSHDDRRNANVECYDLRLQGGRNNQSGRVEVQYEGEWGTVCDHGWNHKAANVICRQLGFLRAERHTCCSAFGRGRGPILMDQVECQGDEPSIALCRHSGWRAHACSHSDDAGVVCTNEPATPGLTTAAPHGNGSTKFCDQHSCMNGGFCPSLEGGAVCQCPENYTGDSCEVDIGGNIVDVVIDVKASKLDLDTFKLTFAKQLNEFCRRNACVRKDFDRADVVILRNYPQAFADGALLKIAVYSSRSSKKEVVPRAILSKFIQENGDVIAGYHVIMYSGSTHMASPRESSQTKSTNQRAIIIGVVVPLALILILVLAYALSRWRRKIQSRRRFPANYSDQSYMALHADDDDSAQESDERLIHENDESTNPTA